jgi:hypothetical protein
MKFIETLQTLRAELFNVVGLQRDPMFHGPVQISTKAQRTLAHLLGQDGTNARLLRCGGDGSLAVLPFYLLRSPDNLAVMSSVDADGFQSPYQGPRLVCVTVYSVTGAAYVKLSDSPLAAAPDYPVAFATLLVPCYTFLKLPWLFLETNAGTAEVFIATWNLA